MKKHMSMNSALLQLIQLRGHSSSLYRVLESLSTALRECGTAIDLASKSGDDEYYNLVVDDECDVTENLLGAAFVSCQAEITSVVSCVIRLHSNAQASGNTLLSSDKTRMGIMALRSPMVGQSGYTMVQVINAFANFFKHYGEWNDSWSKLKRKEKQTADIVAAVGAQEYSTGPLRAGAHALALGGDYDKLPLLADGVRDWSSAVQSVYTEELTRLNLL